MIGGFTLLDNSPLIRYLSSTMKLPLRIEPGLTAFYLCDAEGTYLVRSIGDSTEALAALERLRDSANAPLGDTSLARSLKAAQTAPAWRPQAAQSNTARSLLDDAFARMPNQPTDMADPEGLAAYAEAIALWRTECGYPEQYDGPSN